LSGNTVADLDKATSISLSSEFNKAQASTTTIDSIKNLALADKDDVMGTIYSSFGATLDNYKSAAYYDQRNKDVKELQDAVVARTAVEAEAYDRDIENAKRQAEINDWSAYNKLDTLFVSQLLFIALVFIAPLVYLKTRYLIPSSVFYGILLIVVLILVFTITWRVQYTDKSRSNRFWHRRRFGEYSQTPSVTCSA
jgi:hypothetical protein